MTASSALADVAAAPVDAAQRRADNLRGALWMATSCLAATGMMIAIKEVAVDLASAMIAFLRSGLGLWVLAPMLLDGSLRRMRLTRPWLHILRGCLMGGALNFGFYAIATLPMTTATILFFLAPVFATALAGPILAEKVGAPRWIAVFAGFVGAAVILRPGAGALEWGMLSAIASAACFSVSLMLAQIIGREDGARTVLVTSTAIATLVTFPIALPVWSLPSTPLIWIWIAALVLFSSARMYADIKAYAVGEAGFVAPFAYLRLLFVAVAGWFLFAEVPDAETIAGGAVIAGATFYIAYRERQLGIKIAGGAA